MSKPLSSIFLWFRLNNNMKHKHHIIPKHMGGSNDPSNIVLLTVEEHAEAHRLLFEKYGHWQDEVAWKGLSGQISGAEINYILSVERNLGENNPMYGKIGYMRGKKHTDEAKEKIKEKRAKQKIIHSEETKKRIASKALAAIKAKYKFSLLGFSIATSAAECIAFIVEEAAKGRYITF